ncbi:hypothetical protein Q6D67_21620 [Haliea sp. E1-2-M8]|uniref:hypothetical protein n=1 Tax=Haliea sp. E1-2-M8 TaxID=3064706 RepID=UPI002726C7C6|nr:hypothetical protein [Haliea sp. E1-2-M8]MDO8864270.1 hypothetical protein [Haliea sp. E1-2-M8]
MENHTNTLDLAHRDLIRAGDAVSSIASVLVDDQVNGNVDLEETDREGLFRALEVISGMVTMRAWDLLKVMDSLAEQVEVGQ